MTNDHFLLNQQATWREARLDRVVLADEGTALQLRPVPGSGRPLIDSAGSFGGLALPASLAMDDEDRIYILDRSSHVVKRYSPCTETFETLPCIGGKGPEPRQLLDPQGIAISARGDLFVADSGNHRVQVFALKGLVLRAIWSSPKSFAYDWQPTDIAITPDGRVFVCDAANGVIHQFDTSGRWRAAYDGASNDSPKFDKPLHIALDKHCNLYVIQDSKDYVVVLDADGKYLKRIERPDEVKGDFCPMAIAIDEQGNVFIGDRVARRIYRYCEDRHGCYTCDGAVRGVSAACTTLAFDRFGHPLIGDGENQCVVMLQAQAAYEVEGRFYSAALDSELYQCVWHRVVMRASIPSGTQVRVDTFTSESLKPDEEIQDLPDSRWATAQIDSQIGEGEWDCLILSTPGRYGWLRLTLIGEGKATPSVQWLRAHYPREASLQYLPATYSEDAISRDFLSRFLSIFDTIDNGISDTITTIARYFDPMATPADDKADFLSWLATWLDLTLERHWPEQRRRELVKHAHQLYRLRGTPQGLRLHLQLYLGIEPRIVEHFKLRRWLFVDHARLGEQSALYGAAIVKRLQLDENASIGSFQLIDTGDPLRDPFHRYAHQFTVFVPVCGEVTDIQRRTIERIVEMAKPAHTQANIKITQPRFRVGIQAFIGVDTVIGRYPDRVVADQAKLGYDTLLGPSDDEAQPPTMRIGKRSRIGSNTILD